jgi:hypothetical protein
VAVAAGGARLMLVGQRQGIVEQVERLRGCIAVFGTA